MMSHVLTDGEYAELMRGPLSELPRHSLLSIIFTQDARLAAAERDRDEARAKSKVWHRLLWGAVCPYCGSALLDGSGPPCQHRTQIQRAIDAEHLDAEEVAAIMRLATPEGKAEH